MNHRERSMMNLSSSCLVIVLSCLLGPATAGSMDNRESGGRQDMAAHPSPVQPNQELSNLIRRTQDLAEQAQAELKRCREQNENLQRLLQQTREELTQLRQELRDLRSVLTARQSTVEPSTPADEISKPIGPGADLASRLAQAEDRVEINATQIKEQAQTKVESDSRFKVRLFGTVLNNTYFNTHDSSEAAVPTAAPPKSARVANGGRNFGSTLHQTTFGFAMTGPKLGEARLSADVEFDFYGGTPENYGADTLGALRMRTASARVDGTRTSLVMGLMTPVFSPLNPASFASVYYSPFGDSGNLWQWRPQIMVERRTPIKEEGSLILQGGLMMPFAETFYGKGLEGKPGYESRIAFARRFDSERRLEIGVGGYIHPQQFGHDRTVNSYAVTGDWLIPLHDRLELSGEAFYGQSITLSAESGADISSKFAFSGSLDNPATVFGGIHSVGCWTQLRAKAAPKLEFNLAFGVEDPHNRDIFTGLFKNTTQLKNQAFSVNSIYRLRSNFLFSLEYRHLWTVYSDARMTNGHINLALGYLF